MKGYQRFEPQTFVDVHVLPTQQETVLYHFHTLYWTPYSTTPSIKLNSSQLTLTIETTNLNAYQMLAAFRRFVGKKTVLNPAPLEGCVNMLFSDDIRKTIHEIRILLYILNLGGYVFDGGVRLVCTSMEYVDSIRVKGIH